MEYIQGPRFQSSDPIIKTCSKICINNLQENEENSKMVEEGKEQVGD